MGLPPVVVGLVVALALWRSGPLGSLGLMYTKTAMAIAQVLIALPLVVGISLAAVDGARRRMARPGARARRARLARDLAARCARRERACSLP